MTDNYMSIAQHNLRAEIARRNQQEEARRAALDEQRRGLEQQREEVQREVDDDPAVQGFLREAEERRRTAAAEAEAERVRAEAERKAAHEAELRNLYEAEKRIWLATGHPAATFDTEAWPAILMRVHADKTASTDAERQRLLGESSVF